MVAVWDFAVIQKKINIKKKINLFISFILMYSL